MEHSPKYETLARKWKLGYITEETLRGYVELNDRKPGKGITAEEFEEITGIPYNMPEEPEEGEESTEEDSGDSAEGESSGELESDETAAESAGDSLENMTVAELKEYAAARGISLSGLTRKADIIAAIRAAE